MLTLIIIATIMSKAIIFPLQSVTAAWNKIQALILYYYFSTFQFIILLIFMKEGLIMGFALSGKPHLGLTLSLFFDPGNFFSQIFLMFDVALAGDHNALCLRRACTMHRFGSVTDRCCA